MKRIIKWFIPKEEKFFDMLKEQSENDLTGAKELKKLVFAYHKLSTKKKKEIAEHIRKLENKGDDITHNLIVELDKTFITPIDKEDIHQLSGLLDDIIDLVDAVSERFIIFNINKMDSHIKKLVEVLVKAVEEVDKAILNLKKLRDIREFHININSLENESDKIYYNAISSLFRDSKNPTEIIKYKDIYELLETITDKCEDVAYIIENIVVKHA